MGYNVNTTGVNFTIPADKLDAATQALSKHNGDGKLTTAEQILREAGFEDCSINEEGGLDLGGYCGKSYDEDQLLISLAPFVSAGAYVNWVGEDGEHWQDYFDGEGGHIQKDGYVIYDKLEAPGLDPAQLRDIVLPALNQDSMDAEHEALSEIADLLGIQYDDSTEQYTLTK